jgi:hypothetical protein
MIQDEQTLTDDDRALIKLADEANDEDFIDFDTFASEMRKEYSAK